MRFTAHYYFHRFECIFASHRLKITAETLSKNNKTIHAKNIGYEKATGDNSRLGTRCKNSSGCSPKFEFELEIRSGDTAIAGPLGQTQNPIAQARVPRDKIASYTCINAIGCYGTKTYLNLL